MSPTSAGARALAGAIAALSLAGLAPPVQAQAPVAKTSAAQTSAAQISGARASSARAAPAAAGEGWITPAPDNLLVVDTDKGRIVAELSPLAAPAHVERIKTLARRHYYDGLTFFRVIDGFMDQTGDPKNTGESGSELPNLKAEFTFRRGPDMPFTAVSLPAGSATGFVGVLPVYTQADALMGMTADGKVSTWAAFCPGVLGMARDETPDSANSQFFFMRGPYPALEKRYTAFGRVLVGQEVVGAIKIGEPVAAPQDRMIRVRLASDLPPAERPKVQRLDPASPAFQAAVDKVRLEKGADFSICDVAAPARGS